MERLHVWVVPDRRGTVRPRLWIASAVFLTHDDHLLEAAEHGVPKRLVYKVMAELLVLAGYRLRLGQDVQVLVLR